MQAVPEWVSPGAVPRQAGGVEAVVPQAVSRHQRIVERGLRAGAEWGPPALRRMLHYHLGWVDQEGTPSTGASGKALRSALCLFACEAVGGAAWRALPAAVALELAHNFSLVHDDIQDGDRERRHRPTVWAVWGKPAALLAGNSLLLLSDAAIGRLPGQGAPAGASLETAGFFTERCLEMIEGQVLDLTFEGRLDVTTGEYLGMVSRKTGALLEAAMYMGATLGGADRRAAEALGRCGRLLGIGFQARDDLLGVWGDAALTGKATGADIRRRKKSLPVVHGFQEAGPAARRSLAALYGRQEEMDDGAVAMVMDALEGLGSREYTQRVAEEQGRLAIEAASAAGLDPDSARSLEQMADFILHRDH